MEFFVVLVPNSKPRLNKKKKNKKTCWKVLSNRSNGRKAIKIIKLHMPRRMSTKKKKKKKGGKKNFQIVHNKADKCQPR